MHKNLLSALVCALLVTLSMVLLPSPAEAQSITIYVDDGFVDDPARHMWNTIQKGINDARSGTYDTVYVYPGIYNENVVINKSTLTLYGASSSQVTVNGRGLGHTIRITADDVKVKQLKITGGNPAGIYWGNNKGYVEKCDITGNTIGVLLESAFNQTLQCNKIHDNSGDGIQVRNSQLKDLTLNSSYSNGNAGISLVNSSKICVFYNKSYNNKYGISVDSTSRDNDIYLNDFYGNSEVNGISAGSGNDWRTPEQGGRSYCYNGVLRQGYLGNYWGNYAGGDTDGNGIGDTPYSLGSEQDSYPLMSFYSNYPSSCGGQLPSCGAEQPPPAPPPTPTPTPTPPPSPPPGSQTKPTAGGSSVTVDFGYIKVTFAQIIVSGNTWLGPATVDTSRNPAKSALAIVDIGTTASYQGPVQIAWIYDMSGLEEPEKLKIYHFNGSKWENITTLVDIATNTVYGEVTSLSPFLLALGGCFIATAAYGSPLDSHVDTLRSFRDSYLETNPLGSAFVSLYYKISPPLADFIDKHPSLKPIVRVALIPAVAMSSVALNTTPLQKLLVSLALLASLSVAIALVLRQRVRWQRMRRQ
jgi:nitrous oxidase accessory protein NosD